MGKGKLLTVIFAMFFVFIGFSTNFASATEGQIIERDGVAILVIGEREIPLWDMNDCEEIVGLRIQGDETQGTFLVRRKIPVSWFSGTECVGEMDAWNSVLYYGRYYAEYSSHQPIDFLHEDFTGMNRSFYDYILMENGWPAIVYVEGGYQYSVRVINSDRGWEWGSFSLASRPEKMWSGYYGSDSTLYLIFKMAGGVLCHLIFGEDGRPAGIDSQAQELVVETEEADGRTVYYANIDGQRVKLYEAGATSEYPYAWLSNAVYFPTVGGKGTILFFFFNYETQAQTLGFAYDSMDGKLTPSWSYPGWMSWIIPTPKGDAALIQFNKITVVNPHTGALISVSGINPAIMYIDAGGVYFTPRGDLIMASCQEFFIIEHAVEVDGMLVTGTSPANGETGVDVNSNIRLNFSLPLANGTVNPYSFTIVDDNGKPVDFSLTVTDGNTSVTLAPLSSLIPGATYLVTVHPVMADNGVSLDGSFEFSFTTTTAQEPNPAPETPVTAGNFSGGGCFISLAN